jgi:membrane protease YdiL (CAAX protease family)
MTDVQSPTQPAATSPARLDPTDRYATIPQHTALRAVVTWVALTLPMAVLAWVVVPWLSHRISGPEPLAKALLVCFGGGLLWMLALTVVLVRREVGHLTWPQVRDALWLRAPRDPKSGRVGGRVWFWLVPFVLLSAALEALPINPVGPIPRDLPRYIATDRAERFFEGNWTWFAVLAVVALLAPIVEEIVFRGYLLPRSRNLFGRGDWVANGVLFAAYHLHQPWSIPATLLDSVFAQSLPTKRYRSTWIALIGHTLPSFVIIGAGLSLVL